MNIVYKDIILRDRTYEDLKDYIDWYTVETEWQDWDAPWEKEDNVSIEKLREGILRSIERPLPNIRRRLEICYKNGEHIGWMNSYYIDGNINKLATGIDIPCREYRGKGLGEQAFKTFSIYLIKNLRLNELYTETWSGNQSMIALAVKCGYRLNWVDKDYRVVNGKYVDGLELKLRAEHIIKNNKELFNLL